MKLRNKKTGEIVELKLTQVNDGYFEPHEVNLLNGEKLTLKLLVNSFDDAKEPLIKDEKIRKAVRAWAEANDITGVFYEYDYSNDVAVFMVGETKMIIEADELLDDSKGYTIAELCGEEEE